MSWSPPRKYKGYRTDLTHAIKVTFPRPSIQEWKQSRSMLTPKGPSEEMIQLCEMEQWCEDNCKANWSSMGCYTWYFDRMNEAVMFKMIFGGK